MRHPRHAALPGLGKFPIWSDKMAGYSPDDLTRVRAAIANGLTQAMIQGEMVQYRSLAELRKIEGIIAADLSPSTASGEARSFGVRYPVTDRGV